MKLFAPTLMRSGLGLILLTAMPSFASVTGNLYTGGTGTVTVTDTSVTFTENNTTPVGSSTAVGAGTTVTYDGGALMPGQPVDVNGGSPIVPGDLVSGGGSGVSVIFPDSPTLDVTIDNFGPGSTNTDCADLTTGESCSPSLGPGVTSPIILTYTGPGTELSTPFSEGTDAVLPVTGTASDGSGTSSTLSGSFSATIPNETPEQLATLFDTTAGASFSTTYSGSFMTSAPSAVPEPRELSLLAGASLLMGLVVFKRRKKV